MHAVASAREAPGPREWIPGATVAAFLRDPLDALTRLATYGDFVRFRWGPRREYLVNHPELIERVLVTNQRSYMKGIALQEAKRLLGDGLLTSEPPLHLRQRRLIQPLFHRRYIEAYAEEIVAATERAQARWQHGETRDVQTEMTRLTLAIVGRTLFSADVEGEAGEIGGALTDAMEALRRFMLPYSGVLDRLPLPTARRLRAARERLDATIFRLIEERRSGAHGSRDLLSQLLEARDDDGEPMDDRQVRDEAMTIFLAGHETTANALVWTWLLLSENPEAEARLHAELDAVLGGRAPTFDDLERLPHALRVVQESMRLFPPAWIIGRRALVDTELAGHRVPAGSIVIVSPWLTQRDPRFFADPLRFDPDRWLPEAEAARPRYSYFPFGGGTRRCIGESFALMEARLVLATIARRWRLALDPAQRVEPLPRITLRPRFGLRMRLETRI
jgi:cytochrome P450